MSPHSTQDPCIPYGRGGAGNMRKPSSLPFFPCLLPTSQHLPANTPFPGRRSSIAAAWSTILSHPSSTDDKLVLTSSPDDHYAASKTEPRRRRHSSSTSEEGRKSSVAESGTRRTSWSSVWSGNSTGEHVSRWRRLFKKGGRREDKGRNGHGD